MKRQGQKWRLTKGINSTYCAFELKNANYKDVFSLRSNKEIEDEVDSELTVGIDRLGEIEDVMQKYGIHSVAELEETLAKVAKGN